MLLALLRRATANESLKKYKAAIDDVESVLKLDPSNKRAQELSSKLQGSSNPQTEEVAATEGKKGKRIAIAEVESDEKIKTELNNGKSKVMSEQNVELKEKVQAQEEAKSKEDIKPDTAKEKEVDSRSMEETTFKATSDDSQKQEYASDVPLPTPLPPRAQQLKDAGNGCFRSGQYGNAMEQYTAAIELLKKGTKLSSY